MNMLIFGASGYIGSYLKEMLSVSFAHVYGTYHTENRSYEKDKTMLYFELGDEKSFESVLKKTEPEVIISCIRGDYKRQFEAHKRMSNYIEQKQNGKLIFFSTSNVFDGALEKPHFESDIPKAVSEYGKFKIKCEEMFLNTLGNRAVILRIPEVYGKNCPRILNLRESGRTHKRVEIYNNVFVNYTTIYQIAEWTDYILKHNLTGIFHIGTRDILESSLFGKQLIYELGMEEIELEICEEPERIFQAVLPGRKEIPDSMQLTVKEVIQSIT